MVLLVDQKLFSFLSSYGFRTNSDWKPLSTLYKLCNFVVYLLYIGIMWADCISTYTRL